MNTTPQPIPSVEEVVAAFDEMMHTGYHKDIKVWLADILTARDAYWQQHEQDMYESLEAANKEAMGEARKYMCWCPQCGDALEQHGTENRYNCFGCDQDYELARSRGVEDKQ